MPTLIQDRPIQPSLLPDVRAMAFGGTLGAGGHSLGVKVFQYNRAKALAEVKGGPVVPILADAGRAGLQSCNTASLLRMAGRPSFPARQNPLRASLTSFKGCKAVGQSHQLTCGQGQRLRNTSINTNGGKCVRGRVMFNGEAKADMPAISRIADRGVVQLANKRTSITVLHPTDLGQTHFGPLGIQLTGFQLTTLETECITHAPLSRVGIFGNTFEESLIGPVEIAQGLLQWRDMDSRYPIILRAQRGQLSGLTGVADVFARAGLKVAPVVTALFKRQIVNKAADTRKLTEQFRLLGCGMQFKTIATLDHILTLFNLLKAFNMPVKTGAQCVFDLHVHLVFVTKYRRKVLSIPAIQDLRSIFAEICAKHEANLVECDGEDDHVHLLIHYPPKVALSKLINHLKGTSSRYLREDRPEISGCYRKGVLWSPSYFAGSCGGAPLSVIAEYVKQQRKEAPLPPRPKGRGIRGAFR